MGVDTTTNPTSLTQAQSVIKAQKGGGSPRVPQSVRERKTTGAKEVLPQFQRIHPDRLFPAQMVPEAMNSRPRSTAATSPSPAASRAATAADREQPVP